MIASMCRAIILLLTFLGFAVKGSGQDLFRLKDQKNWSEELTWSDSASIAVEEFAYNEPDEIDEEHSHVAFIKFLKPPSNLVGRRIKLPEDSALVAIRYQLSSVWFWRDPRPVLCMGELLVIAASAHGIELEHDLSFNAPNDADGRLRLFGRRTIRTGQPPWHLRRYKWR